MRRHACTQNGSRWSAVTGGAGGGEGVVRSVSSLRAGAASLACATVCAELGHTDVHVRRASFGLELAQELILLFRVKLDAQLRFLQLFLVVVTVLKICRDGSHGGCDCAARVSSRMQGSLGLMQRHQQSWQTVPVAA